MSLTLHASAAETATVTGPLVQTKDKEYVALFVTVSAISGTSPTLVVKLQESADGANWADVTSFTTASITTTSTVRIAAPGTAQKCADFVRCVSTIGGTTPSITFTAFLSVINIQPN